MIEVTRITAADNIDEIVAAISAASWSENSEIEPADYSNANITASLKQESHIFCIAYHEGQFAGMASAFALTKPDGDTWLYVNEMDVSVKKQQKGVGTELMKFLFTEAIRLGCIEVWLGTEKHNVPANALYKSIDPSEVEEFIGYTFKLKT